MKLGDCLGIVQFSLKRDGEFQALGFVTHERSQMLIFLESEKYLEGLRQNPRISCIIARPELEDLIPSRYGVALSSNPRRIFYELHNYLAQETDFYWTDFPTEISPDAYIHPRAYVAEKNVRIGHRVKVESGVNVLERSIIGEDVILRAGATIGSEGFQFGRTEGGIFRIAHAGGVKLGDRVEVQANCALSRPVFGGFTELGDDTKLDNLVHIAHDVRIGKRCLVAASAMIAGSVMIGDDVWIGPGVSISSEVKIGDKANLTIGSVVTRDVAAGQRVTGNFAIDHDRFIAFLKTIR